MVDISLTRRRLLQAGAAAAGGGLLLSEAPSMIANAAFAPGVSRTVAVEPPKYIPGNSKIVHIERASDPAGTGRGNVVHVTSDEETTHYAFSLASVASQRLTVRDIESLRYDFFVPSATANTIGHRKSTAPDEVWLVLQVPGSGREQVFRTWPIQEPYQFEAGKWITRNVRDEFSGLSLSPWKRLDEHARTFEELTQGLEEAYGDARVVGVGFGRGDPMMGPSLLDIYYDNLVLNGTAYSFPV